MPLSAPLLALALSYLAPSQKPSPRPLPPMEVRRGFEAITIPGAMRTLGYLAGPETQGRGTGQPGFDKAAAYMASRFKELGLQTVPGLDGYFQRAPFFRTSVESATVIGPKGAVEMKDLYVRSAKVDADVKAPAVFATLDGDGKLDDVAPYAGKIVVVPNANPSRRAISQLLGSDAAAVLLLGDAVPENVPRGMRRESNANKVPVLRVRKDAMARALGVAPERLATLTGVPELTVRAKTKEEAITVANVVAMLPGSDPTLKAEYVGIGAHLDHLGSIEGVVFPGADDDGSGSTALVEVATAFAKNPVKPKRSILFMAFFGEEMGLLGSSYLTSNPPIPLDKMVTELQMDMVGRDSDGAQNGDKNRMDKADENRDTLRLVGSKRISTDLDRVILAQNAHIGFRFKYDAEDVYTRSDHYNFAKNGIPIAFFFDGFHPDYHQPTDTIEKINFQKLTDTARLVYLTAFEIANARAAPKKDVPQKERG